MASSLSAYARKQDSGSEDERPLGTLVADATRDLSFLVQDEIQLAKTELKDDVKAAGKGAGMFVGAAFLGLLATIMLSIALAEILVALGLPRWLSYLIVAVLYLAIAGLLAFIGLKQVKKVKAPERAIATSKESVAVLKGGSGALDGGTGATRAA